MKVTLLRFVQAGSQHGWFTKSVELPSVLLPGMGIVADPECDPALVTHAFYNSRQEFIAQLEDCRYLKSNLVDVAAIDLAERQSVWEFYTRGWTNVDETVT